jgi:hypothetical protein
MDVYVHLLPGLGDKLYTALDTAHDEAAAALSRDNRGTSVIRGTLVGSVQTLYLHFVSWAVLGSNQ